MAPVYQSFCPKASPKSTESTIFGAVRPRHLRFVAQVGILMAMATCMALLIDAVGVTPAYCSGATGCHVAKVAARRVLGSVPLPLLGLAAFVGLLVVTTSPGGRWSQRLELAGAGVAATSGLGFILVQAFVLKTFCPFCLTVDLLAMAIGALLFAAQRCKPHGERRPWLHPVAMACLAILACILPALWPHLRPAAATPLVLSGYSQPGRVTVIEFVDLSCSHCRELYPTLEKLRREQDSRVNFVRLHAPLRSHRHARQGARLLQCLLPDSARVEQLTEVLVESPSLDHKTLLAGAEFVGMTKEEAEACWSDPTTEQAIDDNIKLLESLGFEGLPTTYIGGERIVGSLPLPVYVAALDRVSRSRGSALSELVAFGVLSGILVLGILGIGRRWAAKSRLSTNR